jgi:hypothetical protein
MSNQFVVRIKNFVANLAFIPHMRRIDVPVQSYHTGKADSTDLADMRMCYMLLYHMVHNRFEVVKLDTAEDAFVDVFVQDEREEADVNRFVVPPVLRHDMGN